MSIYEQTLLNISRRYTAEVAEHGGRSLARVATIVVNRGSFFDALERGGTCTVRNFDALVGHFAEAENWPGQSIPTDVRSSLADIGRIALAPASASHAPIGSSVGVEA